MPRKTNNQILKRHLILCEGRDAQEFLIPYLNSAALADIPAFSQTIQVMDFGGISDLPVYLQLLRNAEHFEEVCSLLILRDAERDASKAVQEVQTACKQAGFLVPPGPQVWVGTSPQIGFLLFPSCDAAPKNGTLEDLCLAILANPQASHLLQMVDGFMTQLTENYRLSFPRPFKTKLHTYFSIQDDYVSLKIGEAAKANAFDWTSPRLSPLKEFLAEVL